MRFGVYAMVEANALQQLANANVSLTFWNAPSVETEHQILLHSHMRPERQILKYHSQIPLLRRNEVFACGGNDSTINANLAHIWNF